jgi:thymidylate kinase
LQAGRVIEKSYDQKRMRYGEALLAAGRRAEAIEYIRPAIESKRLSKPAWIIAERLVWTAQWGAGAKPEETLEALTRIQKDATDLGFHHQVRVIKQVKDRIRRGRRA